MYATVARHWGLMTAMAGRAGIDLGLEYLDGSVDRQALRDAVFACTRCNHVTECEAHLAHAGGPRDPVPDYCLNRAMIDALRSVRA